MKYWSGETVFNFEWSQVVRGFWHRYPNPSSQHVLTEDMLECRVEGDKLFTKRIITKKGKVPSYLQRFTNGVKYIHFIEESMLDLKDKTFITYTRNIAMQTVMNAHERCEYKVNPSDVSTVLCEKQMWSYSKVAGFGNLIALYGVKQYEKNGEAANNGFNYVLSSMFDPNFQQKTYSYGGNKQGRRFIYLLKILRQIHAKVKGLIFPHNSYMMIQAS